MGVGGGNGMSLDGSAPSVSAGAACVVDCDGVDGDVSRTMGSSWVSWPERSEAVLPTSSWPESCSPGRPSTGSGEVRFKSRQGAFPIF